MSDLLEAYAGNGLEDVQEATAWLKIASRNSDTMNPKKAAYIADLKEGQWYNSVSGKVYGEKMEVIVLDKIKRYVISKPARTPKDLPEVVGYATAIDPSWARATPQSPLETREGYTVSCEFIFLLVEKNNLSEPLFLTLRKTGTFAAIVWERKMKAAKLASGASAPIFGRVWSLEPTYVENDRGSWYSLVKDKDVYIFDKGNIPDSLVEAAIETFESVKSAKVLEGFCAAQVARLNGATGAIEAPRSAKQLELFEDGVEV